MLGSVAASINFVTSGTASVLEANITDTVMSSSTVGNPNSIANV
jgi:hypothetical protein